MLDLHRKINKKGDGVVGSVCWAAGVVERSRWSVGVIKVCMGLWAVMPCLLAHASRCLGPSLSMACKRTFSKMRRYDIDLGLIADETHSRRLISIHAAEPRTQVAVAKVCICQRLLLGLVSRTEALILGDIVVHEKRRGQVKPAVAWGQSCWEPR
jgi:hypothetical protein